MKIFTNRVEMVMDHRMAKNGQWNPIYIKYRALIMILLLKMASQSNNDQSGVFSNGFLRKCLDFYQKHVLESGRQTTKGSNYIFFRR